MTINMFKHPTDEGSFSYFFLFVYIWYEHNSCPKRYIYIYILMNEQYGNIDSSRIGLIILLRERTHLLLLCSSVIYFWDESIGCVSRIEDDVKAREREREGKSHREWYLSIVQSYII